MGNQVRLYHRWCCRDLGGCLHEIIPKDRIEASTYLIIAAAMADTMRIENIIPQHVEAIH